VPFWPLDPDPGWVKSQDLDSLNRGEQPGSYFLELRNHCLGLKYLKFGSGIGKNFSDSQHRVNIAVDPLQLGERYCLLNSLGEEDVILDRVSHYAEPNIKVSSMLGQGFPLFRVNKIED
jgi:hypothetical protein